VIGVVGVAAIAFFSWPAAAMAAAMASVQGLLWRSRSLRRATDLDDLATELETKNLELRTREAELVRVAHEVEEVGHAKDQYIFAISHELRTPLTSIRAYSEMLADFCGDESAEVRGDFLRVIVQESERLTRLINDLLDLARMESGAEFWNPQAINLKAIVKRCFESLGGLAIEKMATFNLIAPDEDILVEGDQDRMQQAITNVLANAWRFSPESADIDVTIERHGHDCSMRVRDHGPGIPAGKLDQVFERFVQVDDNSTERRVGTGLGLAITREIIERHDGKITCENHPEGGAVFVFRLPCMEGSGVHL